MLDKKCFSAARQAIVLLSGGLDSAVTLYFAKKNGYKCYCLSFDYGQSHCREIASARSIAKKAGSELKTVKISLPWKGSSLLDTKIKIPEAVQPLGRKFSGEIPSTYVPGRNIIFLSFAVSYAEAIKAEAVFIGAHAQDYSGYPDCRPEFYRAFGKVVSCGTKTGVEKNRIKIITPLIHKTKSQIIKLGIKLRVPFGLTWSCYKGGKTPCGKCDSCYYRSRGFEDLGLEDPLYTG